MFKIIMFLLLLSSANADIRWAKITFFCAKKCCCGSFADGITASGAKVREGLTLAMPNNIPFGTHVYLADGSLLGVCEDRGGAIRDKNGVLCIDVYIASHKRAIILGKKFVFVRLSK